MAMPINTQYSCNLTKEWAWIPMLWSFAAISFGADNPIPSKHFKKWVPKLGDCAKKLVQIASRL